MYLTIWYSQASDILSILIQQSRSREDAAMCV